MAIAMLMNGVLVDFAHEDMKAKIPQDVNNYEDEDYPHFKVWSIIQIGKAMDLEQVKENSRIIANLSDKEVKEISFRQLEAIGVRIHGDAHWD